VTFHALRSLQSKLFLAFVAAAALLLGSCGGGGASVSPTTAGGALQILPGSGSLYAGVPYTFNVVGGRAPYLITADEPTLLALNFTLTGNQFTVVPNNPGVIDIGLDPNAVPQRTVNIQVRDSSTLSITASYKVLQNFFTGYGQSFSSLCATTGTTAPQACSGLDSVVTFVPVSQGVLYGNRVFQFDKVRGDFQFVQEPITNTPQLLDQIRTTTDQTGTARVRIRVVNNAPTQFASFKMTDIATGVTKDVVFTIVQQLPTGTITVLPGGTITFTGTNGQCGYGSSDQLIYDGAPPYVLTPPAASSISVTPTTVNPLTSGSNKFTVSIPPGLPVNNCPSGTIVINDSQGRRATITVSSVTGGTAPPIAVAPLPITILSCTSNSATAAVIGGAGPLQVISSHPRVFAAITGNILSVTRAGSGDGATIYPPTGTLVITDGTTLFNATVNVPANCP
jgi:hypothetical protein